MGTLRTLLAFCVVSEHSGRIFGLTLVPGFLAIEIFYVVSGFYMALILTETYTGVGAWRVFYVNRFLRLFPIYYAVFALTLVGVAIMAARGEALPGYASGWREFGGVLGAWKLILISLPNFTILGLDLQYFLDISPDGAVILAGPSGDRLHDFDTIGRHFSIIPQAWTLGVELLFYGVVPWIVRWRSGALLGLVVVSVAARLAGYYCGFRHDPWDDRFFPFELALFVAGILTYRVYRHLAAESDQRRSGYIRLLGRIGVIGGIGAILGFGAFEPGPDFASIGYGPTINWPFVAGIALILPFVFLATRHSRIDNIIGQFSYPVYIAHFVFVAFLADTLRASPLGYGLGVSLSTLALSALLLGVTRPIERRRARYATRRGSGDPPRASLARTRATATASSAFMSGGEPIRPSAPSPMSPTPPGSA